MAVFAGLLSGESVELFRVIGHGLADVPPLPEHPGIQSGAVAEEVLFFLFFFYLSFQNRELELFLLTLRNVAELFDAALPADDSCDFRNTR